MADKIIAVDFDGTLCEACWPAIGAPKQAVIRYVMEQQKQGAKLILWTNRCGEYLDNAVRWCKEHGIEFDAVNENLPQMIKAFGNDCRKVYADEYIDDKAVLVAEIEAMSRRPKRRRTARVRVAQYLHANKERGDGC